MDTFRGYEIRWEETEWVFADTGESTILTWEQRPCGNCGKYNTPEGHDGCFGYIPGLMNACCGHGERTEAYAQFSDGHCIVGEEAIDFLQAQGTLEGENE